MVNVVHWQPGSGFTVLAVALAVFVVIPTLFGVMLKLLGARVDDERRTKGARGKESSDNTGGWGRHDAGLIASSKMSCPPPHQRGRRPGGMR